MLLSFLLHWQFPGHWYPGKQARKGQAQPGGSLSELESGDALLSLPRVAGSDVSCTSALKYMETSSSRGHLLYGGHSTGLTWAGVSG